MNDIFRACIYQNTCSDVMCNGGYHPTGLIIWSKWHKLV